MDRTRFELAKEIVLRYYGENGYSEERKYAIRLSLRIIEGLLDELDIEFDSGAISRIVAHRQWSYVGECDLRHAGAMLLMAMESGTTDTRVIRHRRVPQSLKSPEFSEVLDGYLSLLRKMGRAKSTVAFEERENRRLLLYLEDIGIRSLGSITVGHLEGYLMLRIPTFAKSTGQAIIYRLRHFFEYLSMEKGADTSLSRVFDIRIKVPATIVTTLTEEQEGLLIYARKPTTTKEARSRAVTLLCLRLGLRRSDVYKLRFCELDWQEGVLNIVQQKTRKPLTLPLPDDVGYAIADYVVNHRPKVDSDLVFLSLYAPYGNRLTGSSDITRAKQSCGDAWQGCYHILRRTCATRLLREGTSMLTIMGILGQTTMESLDCYLGLDVSSMSLSPLVVEGLGLPEVLS